VRRRQAAELLPVQALHPESVVLPTRPELVAYRLAPSGELTDDLLARVRQNVDNGAEEVTWRAPGTLIAARLMLEWTGDARWRDACERRSRRRIPVSPVMNPASASPGSFITFGMSGRAGLPEQLRAAQGTVRVGHDRADRRPHTLGVPRSLREGLECFGPVEHGLSSAS